MALLFMVYAVSWYINGNENNDQKATFVKGNDFLYNISEIELIFYNCFVHPCLL